MWNIRSNSCWARDLLLLPWQHINIWSGNMDLRPNHEVKTQSGERHIGILWPSWSLLSCLTGAALCCDSTFVWGQVQPGHHHTDMWPAWHTPMVPSPGYTRGWLWWDKTCRSWVHSDPLQAINYAYINNKTIESSTITILPYIIHDHQRYVLLIMFHL